jgi:hypothetical protein
MKSTMQPRPSSDAIKERAHQLWRTQKATEKIPVAIQKGSDPIRDGNVRPTGARDPTA